MANSEREGRFLGLFATFVAFGQEPLVASLLLVAMLFAPSRFVGLFGP